VSATGRPNVPPVISHWWTGVSDQIEAVLALAVMDESAAVDANGEMFAVGNRPARLVAAVHRDIGQVGSIVPNQIDARLSLANPDALVLDLVPEGYPLTSGQILLGTQKSPLVNIDFSHRVAPSTI
jgi:hypothetical protein